MYYTKLGKQTVNAVRFAEVLQVLVRHGFADLLRRAGFHDGLPARLLHSLRLMDAPAGAPETFGNRLRTALMELGPTYVKLGQVLSTRPDLIGAKTAAEFSSLQDRVTPIPFDQIKPIIEQELGCPILESFAVFDEEPVACASLSQVYRAELPTGEIVAVKVQRPGVERVIESDLSLMEQMAVWIDDYLDESNWIDPKGIVEEFARSIRRELDFTIEAQVIERFRLNLEDIEWVFIPRVFRSHSSRYMLTMDWVDGARIDAFDKYEERRCDRKTMAVHSFKLCCRMVFEDRIFHADPHPGNILITYDNTIAILDFGMAGRLEEADVGAIADLFLAIFHADSKECLQAVLKLTTQGTPEHVEALENELADLIAFEAYAIIGGGQVIRGIERAVQVLRRYNLELAPRYTLLMKALATAESVGRTLDPELDFVTMIRPYLEKLMFSRYRPQQVFTAVRRNANMFLRLSRQIPSDVAYLLEQLRRGRFSVQVHHKHLENVSHTMDRASNRLSLSVLTASIIMGSSMLVASKSALTSLGIAGFIFAGVLGLALVVSILWTRKF